MMPPWLILLLLDGAATLDASSAATQLRATQSAVFELLHRGLQPSTALDSTSVALRDGVVGTVRAFEAPDRCVAWCSACSIEGDDHTATLAAWATPSIEVPHLYVRTAVTGGAIELEVDFRNRLNAGYDAACEAANAYPAPASRAAFAQAALRDEYGAAFFTPDAREWRERVRSAGGASDAASALGGLVVGGRRQYGDEDAGGCAGPLALCVSLPLGEEGIIAARGAVEAAAQRWLAWITASADASWMRNRMMFDRDCQVRQLVASTTARALEDRYGEAGRALATADAGRLDMMGHNMMQEQKGFGSDESEGRD